MGVDYTPVAVYGVKLDTATYEDLIMRGHAYATRLAESRAWYEKHNYEFDETAFRWGWSQEAPYYFKQGDLRIVEAGWASYSGDAPTYYLGVPITKDTDSETLFADAVRELSALGIDTSPTFCIDLHVH